MGWAAWLAAHASDASREGGKAVKRIFHWLMAGLLCSAFLGWAFLGWAASSASADEPQPTSAITPASAAESLPAKSSFDVVVLALKDDWQAMRYHRASGESWYALKGDWKLVPEADEIKPPEGDYKLFLAATGDNDFVALRLEKKSGRSWRLAALKWIEMKVLGDEPELPQPQQPPLPLPLPAPVTGGGVD
jgi:hypothetical protein